MDEFLGRQLKFFRDYLTQFKSGEIAFPVLVQRLEHLHSLIFDRALHEQLEPILYEMEVVHALDLVDMVPLSAQKRQDLVRLAQRMEDLIVKFYQTPRSN